jgi:hypothetical protein
MSIMVIVTARPMVSSAADRMTSAIAAPRMVSMRE